jgi:hypothetical protein
LPLREVEQWWRLPLLLKPCGEDPTDISYGGEDPRVESVRHKSVNVWISAIITAYCTWSPLTFGANVGDKVVVLGSDARVELPVDGVSAHAATRARGGSGLAVLEVSGAGALDLADLIIAEAVGGGLGEGGEGADRARLAVIGRFLLVSKESPAAAIAGSWDPSAERAKDPSQRLYGSGLITALGAHSPGHVAVDFEGGVVVEDDGVRAWWIGSKCRKWQA